MKIPWWSKICCKIILSKLPFEYAFWQRLGLFRHGCMDASCYAIDVFNSHVERTGLTGKLSGKTILELGPGDSIATAIIASAHGARAILVDTGAYVRTDISPYLELQRLLSEKEGLLFTDLTGCRTVRDILSICGVKYLTKGLMDLTQIESGAVDLVFSQAVLEHIRLGEFLETMKQCRRILRPGGVCSHRVDLRDHLGGALNNLRFSESVWESSFFANAGFYTNRIQYGPMLQLFSEAGFEVEVKEITRWDSLPTSRKKLAREFRGISDDELCVSGFDVLLH
jgi:SAM-dependent methyltransferase